MIKNEKYTAKEILDGINHIDDEIYEIERKKN